MKSFRSTQPKRTCKLKYKNYREYKPHLRKDFKRNCGYCDDSDVYCGGQNAFHIDHFRPLKLFPAMEYEYVNLIYACSYCNIAKSDDWPCAGTDLCNFKGRGYVDPCDPDFETHFERNDYGRISPKTDVGRYMFIQLKLGLRRHELIWMLTQLATLIQEVNQEYRKHQHSTQADALLKKNMELSEAYFKYKGLYEETI